jgi:hypothetical protein
MNYSETAYFDSMHDAHVAAWQERRCLLHLSKAGAARIGRLRLSPCSSPSPAVWARLTEAYNRRPDLDQHASGMKCHPFDVAFVNDTPLAARG